MHKILLVLHPSCPHTRGGGPNLSGSYTAALALSPHTWGWTGCRCRGLSCCDVVPTHVGVDRNTRNNFYDLFRCPHTRGGGPLESGVFALVVALSPHTWGWTDSGHPRLALMIGCPHTRGGGPPTSRPGASVTVLSPHTWGWCHLSGYNGPCVFTHKGPGIFTQRGPPVFTETGPLVFAQTGP